MCQYLPKARKKLFLTYPQELMTPDRQFSRTVMSPFVREINPGLYEYTKQGPASGGFGYTAPTKPSGPTGGGKPPSSADIDYFPGMPVRHPFFGKGTVKNIPGPRRLEVSFDRHGDKILHLDYAKLEIIK